MVKNNGNNKTIVKVP